LKADFRKPKGPIGRAIHNAGWLLGGKGVGGLFSLIYLSLAARALGVENFGIFAVILSYGQAVTNIVQFQSWQTVIRYGAGHLAALRSGHLRRLLLFTALLDLAAGLLGAVLAVGGAAVVGHYLHWPPDEQRMAALFGISLVFGLRGTPTGVLRLFDRFDLAAYSETVLPAMRLIGATVAWLASPSVPGFLIAWGVAELVTSAAMWAVAWRELKPLAHDAALTRLLPDVFEENPGLWRFAWTTNLTSSIGLVWQQVPVLAVSWIGGAGTAGGYRIASQLASALNKPALSLARSIYPEFAKLTVSEPGRLRHVIKRASLIAGGTGLAIVLLVAVAGPWLLHLIGGGNYAFAYPFLLLLTIAAGIDLCGFGLEPAMVALGHPERILVARLAVALVYGVILFTLLVTIGPIGAAAATVCSSLLMLCVLIGLSKGALSRT
jgi:O-antigen/teichoic acid export membrane protein